MCGCSFEWGFGCGWWVGGWFGFERWCRDTHAEGHDWWETRVEGARAFGHGRSEFVCFGGCGEASGVDGVSGQEEVCFGRWIRHEV